MTGELYINGQDAYTEWGVSLEDGAMEALMAPPPRKPSIVNESRLEHGKRRMDLAPRLDERELTLPIHLVAATKAQYLTRYNSFLSELASSEFVSISTSHNPGVTYKCMYVSCPQFSQFLGGIAKFALRLTEPDPTDRYEEDV